MESKDRNIAEDTKQPIAEPNSGLLFRNQNFKHTAWYIWKD